ncbi:MAG: hypothetical protein ABIC04_01495 [Nanoarchaeota archaeon]
MFILSLVYFLILQFSTFNFVGYDSYYHVKLAHIYHTHGLIKEFPWMQFTIFKDNFADEQFLFHLLLVPFTFGNLIFNGKIAIVIFTSLLITVFYWFLKKNRIAWPAIWVIVLLTSQRFIVRTNMVRPISLSVMFFILGIYFILSKKYSWLFLVSFIYSLIHASFFTLTIFVIIYALLTYVKKRNFDYKLLLFNLMGLFLGLLVNPYFPKTVKTLYLVYLKGIFYKVPLSIPILEWMPMSLPLFFKENYLPIILFFFSLFILIKNGDFSKKGFMSDKKYYSILFLLTSLIFLVLTIISYRFVVYWVITAVIFCAFSLNNYVKIIINNLNLFLSIKKPFLTKTKYDLKKSVLLIFILVIIFLFCFSFYSHIQRLSMWNNLNNYYDCSDWIKNNVPKDTNIFIMTWSQFAPLFFFDDNHRYIFGLDEYKMYFYDEELYFKYVGLTRGIITEPDMIKTIIRKDFNSSYIFLDEQDCMFKQTSFYSLVKKTNNFKKEYENEYCSVYSIK